MDANQLRELETLCRVLYESGNEVERAHAQQAVLILQSSAEYIPQCQYVLDNSSSPYALLVASTSLTKLITSHWNNFTTPQRVDIRNYVLGYLAQKGPTLEKFVTTSLIQMVCRLTKYGWFDDEQHREIVAEVTKFLQATVDHCVIGLQILSELVTEMDLPVAGRNITFHRKIAVSFREDSLFRIFQVALTSIKQLQMHNIRGATPQQEARMGDQALSLLIKCLSFDFIGTNPDESSEETGSLQVPTSWRSVIQDPDTLQLLFDFYKTTSPPNTSKCLEALMLFASVIQAYLQSRLDSAEQCALDDTLDNPLDDEGGLYEQLEKLPTLCHFNYRQTGEYIVSVLDPILNQYTEACSILDQSGGAAIPPQQQQQLQSMENQAAWLVYAIGAIIGGQTYSSTSTEGDELVDADLSQRVFRAMQLTEHRIIASGGQTKPSVHFELSLLYYFSSFRKSYIGEQHGMPSAPTPSSSMQPASAGSASSPIMAPSESAMSSKHKAYLRMFERLGLGDHTVVVNMMVTKVGNNLKFWGGTEVIISKTLVLFFEVASGYSSGKLLLGLETVQYLIGNHTAEEFPFLAVPANTRHRTTFHSTIARLIFTTAFDESSERFERFMEPIENVLNQLLQTPNYRVPEVREAVIGVCRDLRGIIQQTHNRRTYSCIFDLLYPAYFPVFARAADELYDHPAVTTALLKFLQELAYNKAQRQRCGGVWTADTTSAGREEPIRR
ncbi:exportin-like protein [Phytophthora infestans T30-4]|uniref:Exportin-like protein n=1 Tax=Phytophthora infestans (strain T30-4) TaxID=403677 RepID=D0P208_PHYIT|nr:exportin-like protein [Phytophthora infestans T30-4]EEY55154.1 exportin-like protein [Phytophthora infestans T30-4]|eukprot:XP_002895653.1 exportin-like protein [Phytophthora infestans T30-4]